MAPVALNIAPGLRPWRRAGITHLLVDEAVALALREAAARPAGASPAPRSVPSRPAASQPPLARPAPASAPARPRPQQQPVPASAPSSSPVSPLPSPAPPSREEPVWPSHWQELWTSLVSSSPRPMAVWTYRALGEDLRGQASSVRRDALRSLIAALNMPKGSHAFWPYALPADEGLVPEMFVEGLRRFRPGVVLLIGEEAATDLASAFARQGSLPEKSLQIALCGGYRFIRLPELEELAALPAAQRERLIAFVRAALS